MKELIKEKAINNKKGLLQLKNACVAMQMYDLASDIRSIELELFPETDEVKNEKKKADEINLLLRMVQINAEQRTCWLIMKVIEQFKKKGVKFSVQDAIKLEIEADNIFSN